MCKAIAYLRVSTKQQAEKYSFDVQDHIINDYCNNNDIELLETYNEIGSAKDTVSRDILNEVISLCVENGYYLIVSNADRLSRNFYDAEKIINTLSGKFIACDCLDHKGLPYIYMYAQKIREQTAIRTKLALDMKRKKEGYVGGRPKGCDLTKAREAGLIARRSNTEKKMKNAKIIALRERDRGTSFQKIADHLNDIGMTTSRGKLFTATTVRRLII